MEKKSINFGITKETKSANNIKILPPKEIKPTPEFPSGYKFPTAYLVNVLAKENFETKNGETEVLQFVFKDNENRMHTHTEWAQDPSDDKFEQKHEGMKVRINHIFHNMVGKTPEGGIGTKATTYIDFFKEVEKTIKDAKNSKGEAILGKVPAYIKLTYYNGNLNFPLSPNFVERKEANKPCKLEVNKKYDTITDSDSSGAIPGNIPGGDAGGDIPNFDNSFE